jgi:hypothetical protein
MVRMRDVGLTVLALACGEPEPLPDDTGTPPPRVFVHVIEGCVSGEEQNCEPSLHLCADGAAYSQVSDIVNVGSYVETPEVITTSFPAADVPAAWSFAVSAQDGTLTDDWLGWSWTLTEGFAVQHCP